MSQMNLFVVLILLYIRYFVTEFTKTYYILEYITKTERIDIIFNEYGLNYIQIYE